MALPRTWLLALHLALPSAALAEEEEAFEPLAAVSAPEHGKAVTADASPVDVGAVETEIGYAPTWNDWGGAGLGFDAGQPGYTHQLTATVTYGLLPDVDVRLAGGFMSAYDASAQLAGAAAPQRGSGLADLAFGARWRFLNLAAQGLELAVVAGAVAPLGTGASATQLGITQGYWSARGALVATKDFGALTLNGEVALEAPVSGDAGGLRSVAQVNAAIGYQLLRWLQPELELNYERTASVDADAHVLAVTAGVVAPFSGGYRLIAAVQHAVWGHATTQTTGAVLAFKSTL